MTQEESSEARRLAAGAAERGDGGDCLLARRDGGVGEAFGLDEAGVEGADADAAGAEFLGEGAGFGGGANGMLAGKIRIGAMRRKLERSTQGMGEIAGACGFGSTDVMGRAFARRLKVSSAEYRSRFRTSGI